MKYPKPGYNNPLVTIRIFELDRYLTSIRSSQNVNATIAAEQATLELDWSGRQPANNSVIAEVAWVGDAALLVKEVTRAADNGSVILFDLHQGSSNHGEVVRILGKNGEQGDEGWIDPVWFLILTQSLYLTSTLDTNHIPPHFGFVLRWNPRLS